MSKIMRVTENSFERLKKLEQETGKSKQDLIELAIEEFSRKIFFNKVEQAYSKLKKNKKDWKEYLHERKQWESLSNNLKDDGEN